MTRLHRFDIIALVITAAFAFGAFTVSAQPDEPTPTFSADVLATQTALEAAIDRLPLIATQSGTLTNNATPAPEVTEEAPANVIINIDNAAPVPAEDTEPSFLDGLSARDIRELALYAIIGILLLILFKQNGKIAELVPQAFALAMVGSVVERAKETESTTDDRWAGILQTLVGWLYRPPSPPTAPAVPQGPMPPLASVGGSTTVTAQTGSTLVITPPVPSPEERFQAFEADENTRAVG